jgi:ribosome modulation factor
VRSFDRGTQRQQGTGRSKWLACWRAATPFTNE